MSDPDQVLEAALSDAFDTSSTPPSRLQAPASSSADESLESVPATELETTGISDTSSSQQDEWKAEYDQQVSGWREESALARDKAEKTRKHWEEVRSSESSTKMTASWATLQEPPFTSGNSPSPADARDLVTGEPSTQHSHEDTGEDAKWENVASEATSGSFPSLTFPEVPTSPPEPEHISKPPPAPPLSVTTAIFDSTLSNRTRTLAVFSALAINFVLPFVNGVMLGFGEIFAKNVVVFYFGWKPLQPAATSSVAGSKGIGIASAAQR